MGLSKLSIWVKDTEHPCLPYQTDRTSWVGAILTCDLQPLHYGDVKNGLYPLTDRGKLGGKVHGQVEVPPGCYIVLAAAPCGNTFTHMAMVQVGCAQEVCVNLITTSLSTCTAQIIVALRLASALGARYHPGLPLERAIPRAVISRVTKALEELREHIPDDPILPALPISLDDLVRMARRERGGRRSA